MRTIMHVDMDAFFASVEVRDHPELKGKPVIIGGPRDSPRGVVSTCSYEARAFGVHSAMPIRQAAKLCPDGIFLPGNMRLYQKVSAQIREVFDTFSPIVEPLSIDEAFLDMTGCEHFYPSLEAMGRSVKEAIRKKVQLTASVGIARNKFLAKLASDLDKPDGLMVVREEDIDRILLPLPVSRLWGVGKKTEEILRSHHIHTIADLRQKSLDWLIRLFGRSGHSLYALARGIDSREVETQSEAKSIGQEITFEKDVDDEQRLKETLASLSGRVGTRLRAQELSAKTVTLKARYPDFTTMTRSLTLGTPFRDDDTIFETAYELYRGLKRTHPLRLIGVYVSHLSSDQQLSLFAEEKDELSSLIDKINAKYGRPILRKGRQGSPDPKDR